MLYLTMIKHVFYGNTMIEETSFIYKICTKKEWDKARASGTYKGSRDDLRDGFIHFSDFEQVPGTLSKHFQGQKGLLLLKINSDLLDNTKLKWEVSRNQMKFPHLYGDLDINAVIDIKEIPDER